MIHVVGLSGGKDSTALALRLKELNPDTEYEYIYTPTGDELPSMTEHWLALEGLLGKALTPMATGLTLDGLIDKQKMLPNWRARWCTRMLKIEPCQKWISEKTDTVVLYIGLRADEEGREGGIYHDCEVRFPFRDWGWGIDEVWRYLNERGVLIPERTDCARCFFQTLGEWWELWKSHPDIYESAAKQERDLGHTFRSPSRDSWPASLDGLRERFEAGDIPRGVVATEDMFGFSANQCRTCTL